MTKEDMQNLIRLVKSNADNNLILLKEILRLKQQIEKLAVLKGPLAHYNKILSNRNIYNFDLR